MLKTAVSGAMPVSTVKRNLFCRFILRDNTGASAEFGGCDEEIASSMFHMTGDMKCSRTDMCVVSHRLHRCTSDSIEFEQHCLPRKTSEQREFVGGYMTVPQIRIDAQNEERS